MKILTLLSFVCIYFLINTQETYAQSYKPTGVHSPVEVTNEPEADPRVTEIARNLTAAKKAGDLIAMEYWETQLNNLTGAQIMLSDRHNLIGKKENEEIQTGNTDVLNISRISNVTTVANAVSTERVNGKIFAAIGVYGFPNADTLKVYKSTNNGFSFTKIFSMNSAGMVIGYNKVDIEATASSDSAYVFLTMQYTTGSSLEHSTAIVRVREDGSFLIFNLFGNSTNKYINPRISSDNAAYTSATYVYVSLTLDSNQAGTRRLKSRLYKITSPFTTFNFTRCYTNSSGGNYAYWYDGAAPDSATFESDIACINTGSVQDQVYTVSVVRGVGLFGGGANIYFSRNTDYGVSAPTLFFQADAPYLKENPRIAAPGYLHRSVLVTTRRLFGGGDWDPYSFYTPDITIASPVFTGAYVNNSGDTTIGVSVAAKYRSNGTYLIGFNNKFNNTQIGKIYIKPVSSGALGTTIQINPADIVGTGFYGSPDVAFRNVNNDSCFTIFAGGAGNNTYAAGGCSGTFVGVENPNSIVSEYKLSQNYPNPFNPATRISYSIPKSGIVTIKLFDVLGKQVAVLVNEVKNPGAYAIDFNASSFASGVYYYKIEAGDFTDTKKMLLVK